MLVTCREVLSIDRSGHFRRVISSIGGTQALLRGGDYFDRETDLKWIVSDLYRGITPISLIKEWAPLFATPLSIAHRVIHKFVGYLEKQATELIWKPRCKTTVKHEKERGITAKHKKSKYTGPRGEWSDGYGTFARTNTVTVVGFWRSMKAGSVQDPHLTHTKRIARCYRACWERGTWVPWRGWGG